jgi:hypothetical protein
MTKMALFMAITEGDLFKSIDQSEEINQFIHERKNRTGVQVMGDPEYQRVQVEKERLETEFKSLYPDRATGEKKVLLFNDLVVRQSTISELTHYEVGFIEGIKFLIYMMMDC